MKNIIILLAGLNITHALAAEADHFTLPAKSFNDQKILINQNANQMIRQAVSQANALGTCDGSEKSEQTLYKELRKYFGNHKNGQLVKDMLKGEIYDTQTIPLNESVYGEWSILNGYLLGKPSAAKSPLALTAMIRIGDEVVGVDKFEHMFGSGFTYFNEHYFENKSLRKVLKRGIVREKTYLGGNILATGVFTYGDLSANFNGMRFWNHVLQKRDDVLGKKHNIGPYIKCENNKFVVNESKPLKLEYYVDASMDESINCSKFATNSGLKKFKQAMLNKVGHSRCPVDSSRLSQMIKKYDVENIGHWIINPKGHGKVSYTSEFR